MMDATTLAQAREMLGMSRKDLAEVLGVDAGTVGRWERGTLNIANPKMVSLAMLGIVACEAVKGEDEMRAMWRVAIAGEISGN